jgi:hypothetical protein
MRTRARRLTVVATGALGVVLLTAAPAFAHTLVVSGTTSCPAADHVVNWTIRNHETAADRTLTIESATAVIGGTTYAVTGFDPTIPPTGSTTASSTVPGDVTGTIVITVNAKWPDGFKNKATGSVDLVDPCPVTTTTTAATTTTTGVGATTTTGGPGVSTASTSVPPTTVGGVQGISSGPTTTSGSGALPFTGSSGGTGAVVGVTALALGLVLLVGAKRGGAFTKN